VADNFEAEARLRQRLEAADPALLDRIAFDSDAEALSVSGEVEADVRRAVSFLDG